MHPILYEACNTPAFVRLSRIKQLGPTELVYPGASHTRTLHSFGVFHLAKRLLEILMQKGADWVTPQGFCAFLAAALFHDVGHFPFAHSLKELPLAEHEQLTAQLILAEPFKNLIEKFGADSEQTALIIDYQQKTQNLETVFYRKLLSGVLDPDKLDYLNRDAFFCGVPYGIQDTDFIFSQLIPDKKRGIVLNSKAILTVEALLFAKYMMYRSVYWHKNVRIATAMMKKTLLAALQKKIIMPEELYACGDDDIFSLLRGKSFDEKFCAESLYTHKLFRIVSEESFDESNDEHKKLQDLNYRTEVEKRLAKEMHKHSFEVLIDIPEKISFESDLWIVDENCTFSQSSTVFTDKTIASFTASLRKVRIAVAD